MFKKSILDFWRQVNRAGISELIHFLNESDFFQAPCSTAYHLAMRGGLAKHSLHVYTLLNEKVNRYKINIPKESIIICGLGHDFCKISFYREGGEPCSESQYNYLCSLWTQKRGLIIENEAGLLLKLLDEDGHFQRSTPAKSATILIEWLKNRPQEPFPELPIVYSVNDQLPLGHGEKSVSILQDFIKLTDIEKLAIRWHMAAWDLSDYSGRWAFNNANKITPLVTLLSTADFEASNILEREEVSF
jgi:hypothetical protein